MIKLKQSADWTNSLSGKWLLGHFIESGFGRQVSNMWAEMLYNRSFREVPEYKAPMWEWLGLSREYYNSNAPFWHNGYEEFDWEYIGNPRVNRTLGTHTYKGMSSLMLKNTHDGSICGVSQKGLHLQSKRKYKFRVFAGLRGEIDEAGLNGFGDTIHSDVACNLQIKIGELQKSFPLTTVPKEFVWEFTADKNEVSTIEITFLFKGSLILSYTSLMPNDTLGGWRKDVVEKMKEVAPSVARFPGGCFVSFYDWESSIGDRDSREPQPSFYWGGLEENDVGLDEFLHLSELVGFDPQVCFNMMTSTPFKARQLVEYLNAPKDCGMGRLRMLNGRSSPYNVQLFEMDNEPGRKWTARQYAEQCVAFAQEMRLADPNIKLMLAAYSYIPETLPQILEIAGKDIDYIIYRVGNPEFVNGILSVIREYNKNNGTCITMVNTEWLPSCRSIEPFEDPNVPTDFSWKGEITNNYATIFSTHQISWNYALNGARRLLDYISYGGEFTLANFNNTCNTWGQNVIEATKDTSYLSCMGKVFAWFATWYQPSYANVYETGNNSLYAIAISSCSEVEHIVIVNHLSSIQQVQLPDGEWICSGGLIGDSRLAHITEDNDCIKPYHVSTNSNNEINIDPLCIVRFTRS